MFLISVSCLHPNHTLYVMQNKTSVNNWTALTCLDYPVHYHCLITVILSPSILFFSILSYFSPACRTWGRRSHAMQLVLGGVRRTLSSSSWRRCFPSPGQLPASWTRPPSSASPSATLRWGTSPTRETRRGTCASKDRRPTPQSKVRGFLLCRRFILLFLL